MNYTVTLSKRFAVFFIDFVIIYFASSGIQLLLRLVPSIGGLYNDALEKTEQMMELIYSGKSIDSFSFIEDFYRSMLLYSVISYGAIALVILVYLVIIPRFWKHQTIGRMAMKCKVVDMKHNNPSIVTLILREIVGTFILFILIEPLMLIVNLILLSLKGTTITDVVSHTTMVDTESTYQNNNKNHSYINLDKTDFNENLSSSDSFKSEAEDKSSNDDYMVF